MNPKHIWPLLVLLAGCGDDDEKLAHSRAPLTAICVDPAAPPPDDGWRCDEALTVECDDPLGAQVDFIYVDQDALACEDATLQVSHAGPYRPGEYTIAVTRTEDDPDGERTVLVCESTLTVVDTEPPTVEPRIVELWPPNHKLHEITPLDCVDVHDVCDEAVDIHFTFASSDEPENDRGDGNTEPDILDFGCDRVSLRAERQGGSDGRVYTLGWRATDDAGNSTEGTCQVIVPHDRSGRGAIDSGEDHRAEPDDRCDLSDGAPTPPSDGDGAPTPPSDGDGAPELPNDDDNSAPTPPGVP